MGNATTGWQRHLPTSEDRESKPQRVEPLNPDECSPHRLIMRAWRSETVVPGGMTTTSRRVLILLILVGVFIPIALMVFIAIAGISNSGDMQFMIGAMMTFIPFFLLFAGINLALFNFAKRVGDTIHCAKCDYMLAPYHDEYDICPECGNDVARTGGTVKGTRCFRRGVFACGCGMILLSILAMSSVFSSSAIVRLLPSEALSWYALFGGPLAATTAWSEIANRQLSTEERDRIAGRVLDRRMRAGLDYPAVQWLNAEVAQGTISDELVERYYDEAYRFELLLPDEVERGECLNLQIVSDTRDPIWIGVRPYIVYDTVMINGMSGRPPDRTQTRSLLGVCKRSRSSLPAACYTGFGYRTDKKWWSPGSYEFELSFWIMYLPTQQGGYEIEWSDDGTPILPDGCEWAKRYELVGSTRIVEAPETSASR